MPDSVPRPGAGAVPEQRSSGRPPSSEEWCDEYAVAVIERLLDDLAEAAQEQGSEGAALVPSSPDARRPRAGAAVGMLPAVTSSVRPWFRAISAMATRGRWPLSCTRDDRQWGPTVPRAGRKQLTTMTESSRSSKGKEP